MNINFDIETLVAYISLYGMKLLGALVIFLIGKFLARKATNLLRRVMERAKIDDTLVSFGGNVSYGLLLTFVVIAALGQLGIQTTSLAAIIGAAGLAIGFALQGSLSNLAAGVMLIIFRPFKIGDYVEAGGTSGTVEDISIFTTALKTPDNKSVVIPNGKITDDNIINYSAKAERRIDFVFGIGYGDDIKKAKDILGQILATDERILKDPAPTVAVLELADSSVNFAVRPWVKTADYWDVYFDITEQVKLRFDKEGISIPFPQQDVHVHGLPVPEAGKKAA